MAAEHPLRTAAKALSAGVRRDRGQGLYIVRGPLSEHEFFLQQARGEYTVLYPALSGYRALREWLSQESEPGFDQFDGRASAIEDTELLCAGIKLLETACTPAQAEQYEKALRHRAAVLLREHKTGEGGALPLCMEIAKSICPNRKGECK